MKQYKSGNEFLPYHASASHPPPDFRDGWNACFAEAEIRITSLEDDLKFVERWAVHHGTKSHMTAENALSIIQHYPPISAITKGYVDGKVPDTFNPFARITELQAQLAGAEAEITAIKQGLHRASFDNESLKKDAGRLDWIIENAVVREDDDGFVLTLFVLVCHQDVRLAIDAAIQAEGKA